MLMMLALLFVESCPMTGPNWSPDVGSNGRKWESEFEKDFQLMLMMLALRFVESYPMTGSICSPDVGSSGRKWESELKRISS